MIKLLYVNGRVTRTRLGHSLRHMTDKDGSRPVLIEYDEVDWESAYERLTPQGMIHWWETHVSGALEEGIKINPPKKLKDFMYPEQDHERIHMYFETFRPKNPSLLRFINCECGNKVLSESECACGRTAEQLPPIPEVTSNIEVSEEDKEKALAQMKSQKGAVFVEDRSTECVGCQ